MGKDGFVREIPNGDGFQRKKMATLASGERQQRDLRLKERQNREELPREKRSRLRGKD